MPANPTPVLWHLKVSHYNEKARWALDFKRLPHFRRAITPGTHPRIARKLTGGRTFTIEHTLGNPDLFIVGFFPDLTPGRRRLARASFPLIKNRARAGLHINAQSIEAAWTKIEAAGKRFRSELRPSGYLAGDDFTVADLTLAALVAPPLAPPQFPYPQPQRGHPLVEPVRQALDETGIREWALEIYAKHRGESAEIRQS